MRLLTMCFTPSSSEIFSNSLLPPARDEDQLKGCCGQGHAGLGTGTFCNTHFRMAASHSAYPQLMSWHCSSSVKGFKRVRIQASLLTLVGLQKSAPPGP